LTSALPENTRRNDFAKIIAFAKHYAEAWCNQNPENMTTFFAENGLLSVNDGPPAVGRAAIAEVARGFMRDLPDMVVTMDEVTSDSDGTKFHWTLTGTNTGPGGTGKRVRISGYELWQFNSAGLIAESKGHFDNADYERQLKL
jgi:predicted ester cyclase